MLFISYFSQFLSLMPANVPLASFYLKFHIPIQLLLSIQNLAAISGYANLYPYSSEICQSKNLCSLQEYALFCSQNVDARNIREQKLPSYIWVKQYLAFPDISCHLFYI